VNDMKKVLDKLKNGEDFQKTAEIFSEDNESVANGGVLGEFTEENYPEFFKDVLIELKAGEYSDVVRESNILYIFANLGKTEERVYDFSEIKENLKNMVIAQKEQELYQSWIKEIMQESYVEIEYE